MQISTNGGSSYITSGYLQVKGVSSETAAGVLGNDVNTTSFMVNLYTFSSTTGVCGSSVLYLYNATSGSGYVECWGNGVNL